MALKLHVVPELATNFSQLVSVTKDWLEPIYQGSPSWLLVKVAPEYRSSSYRCELLTRSGHRIRLKEFRLDRVSGTARRSVLSPHSRAV